VKLSRHKPTYLDSIIAYPKEIIIANMGAWTFLQKSIIIPMEVQINPCKPK